MSFPASPLKIFTQGFSIWIAALLVAFVPAAAEAKANVTVERSAVFGVIKGIVRDEQGIPIADAAVAVFYAGTSKLLKQVRSASDGSFLTRVIPGTYTVLAVAQGFNAMTVNDVQVERSAELNYGFKLERAGSGNTLPEKMSNRRSSEWRIRASQASRSIFQQQAARQAAIENAEAAVADPDRQKVEGTITAIDDDTQENADRKGQSVVETYFADTADGSYEGLNLATLQPIGEDSDLLISGQFGTKSFAPGRVETSFKTRVGENHHIQLTASASKFGKLQNLDRPLGQVSFQALDEWKVKDGLILVLGMDYSRFVGAGDDSAINPRFGLQFDVDAKTRFRTSYVAQTEEKDWSHVVELEDSAVAFRSQNVSQIVSVEDFKPKMNKSRRFEFGVERVLDNNSSIEAAAFFDAFTGRGVCLTGMPVNALSGESFEPFTAQQQGAAQGIKVIYTRRLGKVFSAYAGYSFGKGQKLSVQGISNPSNFFENATFQNFIGQINADLKTGTRVKTIFRFSPEATVFAIDPFQGRFAIYDPGLSIVITQPLPTLGLPIHAEAVIDARNILDFQTGVKTDGGTLQLDSQRRTLRGGISVRF